MDFFFGDAGRQMQTFVLGLALLALVCFSLRLIILAHGAGLPGSFALPALWWFCKGLILIALVWWMCSGMRLLGVEKADMMWRLVGIAVIGFLPLYFMIVRYDKLYWRVTGLISNDEEPVREASLAD